MNRETTGDNRPALPHEHVLCLTQDLDPQRPGLTLAMAFELDGGCDPRQLLRALNELVARHEALRTRFVRSADSWVRVVDPAETVVAQPDRYCVGETLPAGIDSVAITALLEERCRRCPDLAQGPLFHATVFVAETPEEDGTAPVRLVVRVHHSVADLWSVGVLMAELFRLYAQDPALPPPTPLRHQPASPERLARARHFWSKLWEEGPASTNLPRATMPPAPTGVSRSGFRVPVDFGEGRSAAVRAFAKACGTSCYALLFAAQALALARYGNSSRAPLSVSMNARTGADGPAVGYGLSTAVLPVDTASGTARDLVRRVHHLLRGALANRCLGYPDLVAPNAGRTSVSMPAVSMPAPEATLAMFQDPPGTAGLGSALLTQAAIPLGGLTMRTLVPPVSVGPWQVATALADDGHTMHGFVDVDPAHHPAWLAQRLAEMLPAVVDALAAHPETPLKRLDIVTPAQRELRASWSTSAAEPGIHESTLHGEVLTVAARHPDRVAVITPAGELTYGQLAERSAAFAAALHGAGITPGSTVGVLLTRGGGDLVPALVGVLRAGCAYVGLDRLAPAHRTTQVVTGAHCSAVITDDTTHDLGSALPCPIVQAAQVPARPDTPALPGAEPSVAPGDPAYLMFTSGSTGRPKGVAIAHHSAVNLIRSGRRRFTADELSESLAVSGIHFDLSVWEIFLPLSAGGRVRILENALELADSREPPPGTFLSSVPSAVAACVHRHALPPGLRLITMGGDTISASLVRDIARQCPKARIVAMYGPTETTTYMTWSDVGPDTTDPVPLGRPFGGTVLRVVDEHLRDVPPGATGELLIGGPCVALGYAGEAAMTAAGFLPDPELPGARLYRSGDLVRLRPDGLLDFAGRVDHQVKIRGFRIELGEIEAALRDTAPVKDVVVHAVGDGAERRLLACLVPAERVPENPAEWLRGTRDRLADRLPGYMVPSHYTVLDEIPKNRNGKPDRRRIALLPAVRIGHGEDAPLTGEVQDKLGGLWRQLLHVPTVGARDDFFESGGHSLLLARLAWLITAEFDVDVQIARLWNARTIADQEAVVIEAPKATAAPATRPVRRLDRTRHLHGQEAR